MIRVVVLVTLAFALSTLGLLIASADLTLAHPDIYSDAVPSWFIDL